MLLIYYLVFFISLWLGYNLMASDPRKPILLLTGYGLGFYAAAIFLEVIQTTSPPEISQVLAFVPNIFIYLPALLWTGILIQMFPTETPQKTRFFRLWLWIILPLCFLAVLATGLFGFSPLLLTIIVLLPLVCAHIFLLVRRRKQEEKSPLRLPLIATIFNVLVVGLALPFIWLPRWLVILSLGLPLILLGIGVVIFDASRQGQRLWAGLRCSLMTAAFLALLFGIQIILVIILDAQLTFGIIVLAFSLLSTITFLATFSDHLRKWLSKLLPDKE